MGWAFGVAWVVRSMMEGKSSLSRQIDLLKKFRYLVVEEEFI